MADLLINSLQIHWSSTTPAMRALAINCNIQRPGAPTPTRPEFLVSYDMGRGEPIYARTFKHTGIGIGSRWLPMPPADHALLLSLATSRNTQARGLLEAFFEGGPVGAGSGAAFGGGPTGSSRAFERGGEGASRAFGGLRRSRLPNTPLIVSSLDITSRSEPGQPVQWLGPGNLPMGARLFNLPGQPFGGLVLRWAPNGRLRSVTDDSLQQRQHRGNPLAAMSKGEMAASAALAYFRLRYTPDVAAGLEDDLAYLNREGGKLALELLRVLG